MRLMLAMNRTIIYIFFFKFAICLCPRQGPLKLRNEAFSPLFFSKLESIKMNWIELNSRLQHSRNVASVVNTVGAVLIACNISLVDLDCKTIAAKARRVDGGKLVLQRTNQQKLQKYKYKVRWAAECYLLRRSKVGEQRHKTYCSRHFIYFYCNAGTQRLTCLSKHFSFDGSKQPLCKRPPDKSSPGAEWHVKCCSWAITLKSEDLREGPSETQESVWNLMVTTFCADWSHVHRRFVVFWRGGKRRRSGSACRWSTSLSTPRSSYCKCEPQLDTNRKVGNSFWYRHAPALVRLFRLLPLPPKSSRLNSRV